MPQIIIKPHLAYNFNKNSQQGKSQRKQQTKKMQNENKNHLNNPNTEEQQQIVLFKFKRAFRQESFDEIKIHSKKIKANPESNEKATQQYKKRHFLDREAMLTEMFQKLELQNNQSQSNNARNDIKTQQSQQKKSSYFLKRVQLQQLPSTQQQKPLANEQIKIEANRIRGEIRRQGLQQRLNRNRGIFQTKNEGQKKRIKYKIIDIKQENLVQLNGQKIEYEDLSKQYNEEEKLRMGTVYDYYVLRKGKVAENNGYQPEIILPQQAQYLLENEQDQGMNEQTPQQSQEDSNREDRSDYDYPQEDYHQGDSDNSSEGIISGDRHNDSDYDGSNEDYNLKNDYKDVEDQEEYYRQYLKRCRRKEKGDEQITYLYNMKPAKYQDDSDQY